MIKVTRLNKSEFWINPHLIEFMEETPDTVLSLNSGRKVIVVEKADELLKKIIDYRHRLNLNNAQE
jgi:flagellar protein FlbD